MNVIDIGLVVLLLLCAIRGTWRGIFRESFGFLGLLVGLWAALRGAEGVAAWMATRLPEADINQTALLGVAFVAIFLVGSGLLSMLGIACDQVLGRGPLRLPSRAAGAIFAAAKGATIAALALLFLQLFPLVHGLDRQILDSRLGRPLVARAEQALRAGWHDSAAPTADRRA